MVNREHKSYMLTIQTVLGGVGYTNNVKIAKTNMETHVFMHASSFVINYLNKNKFFFFFVVALSTFCDTLCTL